MIGAFAYQPADHADVGVGVLVTADTARHLVALAIETEDRSDYEQASLMAFCAALDAVNGGRTDWVHEADTSRAETT